MRSFSYSNHSLRNCRFVEFYAKKPFRNAPMVWFLLPSVPAALSRAASFMDIGGVILFIPCGFGEVLLCLVCFVIYSSPEVPNAFFPLAVFQPSIVGLIANHDSHISLIYVPRVFTTLNCVQSTVAHFHYSYSR